MEISKRDRQVALEVVREKKDCHHCNPPCVKHVWRAIGPRLKVGTQLVRCDECGKTGYRL